MQVFGDQSLKLTPMYQGRSIAYRRQPLCVITTAWNGAPTSVGGLKSWIGCQELPASRWPTNESRLRGQTTRKIANRIDAARQCPCMAG
jgi:hypothetical protein